MISCLAKSSIETLQRNGFKPTVEDIIRLNALGLKLEAAKQKNPLSSLDYLPRIAQISPEIVFRQPTIAHEIWLEKISRFCADDIETIIAVRAFALSRPAAELPDPESRRAIKTAVENYAAQFAGITRDQLVAALSYVIFGASPLVGEYAAPDILADDTERIDLTDGEDWKRCVAVGVLYEARACLFGVTEKELESMTRRQVEELIGRAYIFHKLPIPPDEERLTADFYRTLDEITERLNKEASNG